MTRFWNKYIELVLDSAAVKVLKDWRYMEERLDKAPSEIIEAEDRMFSIGGLSNGTPVQGGGGNRTEEKWVNGINAKTLAENSIEEAREYFETVRPVWKTLTDRERYLITERWIEGGNGINRIMERLNIEKSAAYEWSNNALTVFRKRLFW